ncbi:MAG: aspartate aminotransferase family protein [candidate division Zixibacteria bacterium]|nr:aspartate aminotransferase family protein [candidate division Zixibacteria bacterium]MDD5426378.1 aspartate aminotransferase family protein [candidate division Zixibacteria bacterium]
MNGVKKHEDALPAHVFLSHPVYKTDFTSAADVYLYDSTGRKYMDFESGIWCASLGHNHPAIAASIHKQLDKVIHLGATVTSPLTEETAITLLRHTPYEHGRAVFLSSGSEAVELSLKLARLFTGRNQLVTFTRSYLGAYGFSGQLDKTNYWQLVDIDNCLRCSEEKCTWSCRALKHINPDMTAAFIIEPVLASGGILFPPVKCVKFLAGEINTAGGLFITNEVTTGLGRTGRWLGIEHHEVTPDLIVFGKTLGNGYPVSAVAMSRHVADMLLTKDFYYVQSHQNDPLGCAAAKAVLETLEAEKLIDRSQKLGDFFKKQLGELQSKHNLIRDIRGVGLMYGLELNSKLTGGEKGVVTIVKNMLAHGFYIGFKPKLNLLRFFPPYTIREEHILELCRILDKIFLKL